MDSLQLSTICKQLLGTSFEGVFASNNLPMGERSERTFIINTDTSNLPGQHWIAVCIRENIGYVFDPLAMIPPPLRLINWMNKRYDQWSYNKRQVQPIDSTLCGAYCIHFLYHALNNTTEVFDKLFENLYPSTNKLSTNEANILHFMYSLY